MEDEIKRCQIYEIAAGNKGESEYLLIAPDKRVLLGRRHGTYLDESFVFADEGVAMIWDRNPRHQCETVKVVSKKDINLDDIPELTQITPEDLGKLAKGE